MASFLPLQGIRDSEVGAEHKVIMTSVTHLTGPDTDCVKECTLKKDSHREQVFKRKRDGQLSSVFSLVASVFNDFHNHHQQASHTLASGIKSFPFSSNRESERRGEGKGKLD